MNHFSSIRSVVVLGIASMFLAGAVVGSVTTVEHDLDRSGGTSHAQVDERAPRPS